MLNLQIAQAALAKRDKVGCQPNSLIKSCNNPKLANKLFKATVANTPY